MTGGSYVMNITKEITEEIYQDIKARFLGDEGIRAFYPYGLNAFIKYLKEHHPEDITILD